MSLVSTLPFGVMAKCTSVRDLRSVLFLFFVFIFFLVVSGGSIGRLVNIKPGRSKRGETLGEQNTVFINIKTGTAYRAGLIPWIK